MHTRFIELGTVPDLGRRRFQAPKVFREGNFWKIRVYEDALDEDGKPYRARPKYVIGPCHGPYAMTERQAAKEANETILRTLNNYSLCPNSVITLEQFVAQHFLPKVVRRLKHAGQEHYKYTLGKILPALGKARLRNLKAEDIWKLVSKLQGAGLSTQTVAHVRTTIATIFNCAKEQKFFNGDNPASAVHLPEIVSPERYAYSLDEAREVLRRLHSPIREMVFLSSTTSLNVAELCGLRRKRLNLTDQTIYSAGEAIPPLSALVRENYYRNRWGTVKSKARRRTVGLPDHVAGLLSKLLESSPFNKADDPVFTCKTGAPVDAHNTNSRIFRKISKELKIPVTWHIFRHSAATFMEALGMPLSDREKLMGHARSSMTQHYTHSDVERRRKAQNELAELLRPQEPKLEDMEAKGIQ
ncbi:MAG: site-specific integrase [Bryobacteraceae bacterium]